MKKHTTITKDLEHFLLEKFDMYDYQEQNMEHFEVCLKNISHS